MKRQGYLGIDAGTQGLSVIFTDLDLRILAGGEGSYAMVQGLPAECSEQHPADWEAALTTAIGQLRSKLAAGGIEMDVVAIGISGQMHGEVLADAAGRVLGPARLWCDARNEAEGHELTESLGTKCPKRLTASRWLWTLRNRPELASKIARMTTEEVAAKVATISEENFENETQLDALTISMIEMDESKFEKIVATNIEQLGFERTMLDVINPFLEKLGFTSSKAFRE
jgi:hypothetical protein